MSSVDTYGRNISRRVSSRSSSGRSRSRSARRRRSRSRVSSSRRHGHHRSRSSHRSRSRQRSSKKKPLVTYEYSDDASDESVRDRDDDDFGKEASRAKKLKKIDVDDPLSAFSTKTKTRLGHIAASEFCKTKWNIIRGMDPVSGKFLVKDRPKSDDWQKMAKSDRLINKWSGDPAFADTKLDDGLSSVVPKVVSKEETDLVKTQRAIGALGHMVLSANEGFKSHYEKLAVFVNRNIGSPKILNPDFDDTVVDASVPQFLYSEFQEQAYQEFVDLQKEWQLDVSEPLAIAARTAAAWHIKIMAIRREKIVAKISKVNQKAANAISKIPPSAHGMFGGDAAELEKVVKLARDLGGSRPSFQPFQTSSTSFQPYQKGGGNPRGGGYGSHQPRGGFKPKGGGFKPRGNRGSKNPRGGK